MMIELTPAILGTTVGLAFITAIALQLMKPYIDKKIGDAAWRKIAINGLAYVLGILLGFAAAIISGNMSVQNIVWIIVQAIITAALATGGYENVKNLMDYVNFVRSGGAQ